MNLKQVNPTILNADARADIVIVCDHASNHVPAEFEDLGLEEYQLEDHIAVDIGAAETARMMAEMMDAPAVLQNVSRLVIDVNRGLDHAGLIPAKSDGIEIPGNRSLSMSDTEARVKAYYEPFHTAAADIVNAHLAEGRHPFVVGMHSFTPNMNGEDRPWHIGLMWDRDPRLAQAMFGVLERDTDLVIGANKPYSGRDLFHTLDVHGARHGLPAVTVEIRNDILCRPEHQMEWAALMTTVFEELFGREDLARLPNPR